MGIDWNHPSGIFVAKLSRYSHQEWYCAGGSYPVTYTVMRYKTELNKQDSTHFSSSVINFYVNCSFCEIDFLKPKNLNL